MILLIVDICCKFIEYFGQYGYQVVFSFLLVLVDDFMLLFINVGMNQFKDVFFGFEKCSYI